MARRDKARDRSLDRNRHAAIEGIAQVNERCDRVALETAHAGGLDEHLRLDRLQHAYG
jgi:hypothetical protein